jgi:acyl-coenzyme A thioesterase PaaI-like protein
MIEEKYRAAIDFALSSIEGLRRTGLKVVEMRPGYVKLFMPFQGNAGHIGTIYAGSLFSFGECMGGMIHIASFDMSKFFPLVKEVSIKFKRPAVTDVTLELIMSEEEIKRIQDEADKNGKADFVLDLEIKDTQEKAVSTLHGVWQIRKFPEGMPNPFAVKSS